MHFSVSSCPSAAARFVLLVLPSLLLSVICTNVVARQIDSRSIAAGASSDKYITPPKFITVPRGPFVKQLSKTQDAAADELTGVSYEVTGTDISEPVTTVVAGNDTSDSTDTDFTSYDIVEETGSRLIQKIRRRRPPVKALRSLKVPDDGASAFKSPGNPMTLSQVITNVLYGPAWPTIHTSSKCSEDMKLYSTHMQNFTLWATKMLDATSKGPEGILDGNTFSFGNFDQCVKTKSEKLGISGGYSLIDIDYRPSYQLHAEFYEDDHLDDYEPLDEDESAWKAIHHNILDDYTQRHEFHWGVCLPDTCNYKDVQKIVSDVLVPEMKRHGFEANVTIDPLLHTSSQNIYKYSTGFYLVCAMFLLLSLLIVVGTLYDLIFLYYRPKSEHGPMKKIMKPFSLISNIERLLKPSEAEEFSIMNGLKVCCILQCILGHRLFLEIGNPLANPEYINKLIHNEWMGHFKSTIFLETFFVISGFFTFYLITKHLMEKKRLSFIPIMIYRWLRIFPVYGTLIVTYIYVLPYLNDGPYWRKTIYKESERCQTNWWTNILFINNYVHTDELCIIPAWYLASDFHFFIVGTLLTYAVWKWKQKGLIMLGAILALSTIIPSYIIVSEKHRGAPSVTPKSLHDLSKDRYFTEVYIKSHMRAMPYFIGILTGYLYMQMKKADYKFSLKSRVICLPIILISGNIIYLINGIFYVIGHDYNAYEHALYFTVSRLLWSIFISYFIIGHGLSNFGICISAFLGHRVFHVVGKLVFCIYMFQELIQFQTMGSMRTPTYQNLTFIAWRWSGDTLFAIMYAFAINVMIESPFDKLQKNAMKIFFGNKFSKPKSEVPINDEANKSENLKV